MRKRYTNDFIFKKKYSKDELRKHIKSEVDNQKFRNHCAEVANNLNIDEEIVRDLLLDNSFTVLSLIQTNVLKNKEIKINITGYFSLITTLIKYKYTHLRRLTKGKTY